MAAIIEILLLVNRVAPPVVMAIMALVDRLKGGDTDEEISAELEAVLEELRARHDVIQNS